MVLVSVVSFGVSFPVGLHCMMFGTLVTLPFLLVMFFTKVFLFTGWVSERVGWVASKFWAAIDTPFVFLGTLLSQFPWEVVTFSVQL